MSNDTTMSANEQKAARVLGKAVHPNALRRLFELWPDAVVRVRRDVNDYGNRRTIVLIATESGRFVERGEVSCDSGDQYNRAYGIREAFRRALVAARERWESRELGLEPGSDRDGSKIDK